ncbi:DUF1801 domain-containing protein [Mycobacterium sp.]|uniref:DUF1801 domain-containing protein n=1 Tax=Mycobacterium sp. TaxID=1785 RepID=UPI002D93ACA0|nr:DUF1801 domain-containing protein [Mycobacterium sp.]
MRPIEDLRVQAAFDAFASPHRACLLAVRELVFAVADRHHRIGPLVETLKWGQPSYLPEQSRSGTTVRLGRVDADRVALFVHCQTTLVQTWRERFPHLTFRDNRAAVLDPTAAVPAAELEHCIELALTYKLRGRDDACT